MGVWGLGFASGFFQVISGKIGKRSWLLSVLRGRLWRQRVLPEDQGLRCASLEKRGASSWLQKVLMLHIAASILEQGFEGDAIV